MRYEESDFARIPATLKMLMGLGAAALVVFVGYSLWTGSDRNDLPGQNAEVPRQAKNIATPTPATKVAASTMPDSDRRASQPIHWIAPPKDYKAEPGSHSRVVAEDGGKWKSSLDSHVAAEDGGETFRKRVFYELVRAQDILGTHEGDSYIMNKYGLSEAEVGKIKVDGVMKNWPMPPP